MNDLVLRFILIFLLFAGACASNTPAIVGTFACAMDTSPSGLDWNNGSANMLIAGAGADNTPAWGGAFTFDAGNLPSDTWWDRGSVLSCEYPA